MAQASTAAHCLPLHSRGFHIPPIRQVVRQTPTILSRKPTRKPHHHGKPFSCRVSAGPCRQQGKLLQCSDRRRAQIPLPVLPTRHESVSPIPLHAAAYNTPRGNNSPLPHTAVPACPGFSMREKRENAIGAYLLFQILPFPLIRRCLTTPFPS